jgi:hypothetical protein
MTQAGNMDGGVTCRVTKKRTLQKAGFVHVSGWVRQDDAPAISVKISAAAPQVAEALKNDRS